VSVGQGAPPGNLPRGGSMKHQAMIQEVKKGRWNRCVSEVEKYETRFCKSVDNLSESAKDKINNAAKLFVNAITFSNFSDFEFAVAEAFKNK
jgi:hypothetical protein